MKENVRQAIDTLTTLDEVKEAGAALNRRFHYIEDGLCLATRGRFQVGDKVDWVSRYGTIVRGVIMKINRTTATVKCDDILCGIWRVSLPKLIKL
jgi:hypothetical protein